MPKKVYRQNLEQFPQLISISNSASGKKLIEAFVKIDVDESSVNRLQIEAWFDTECEATIELLEWFSEYIDESNVLTLYEDHKYKKLCKLDKLLDSKQYESALSTMLRKRPGILDYDNNNIELQYLETELEIGLDTKQRLDQVLTLNEKLNVRLRKGLSMLKEKEFIGCKQKEGAQEECTRLSIELKETHKKLQCQITRLSRQIEEFSSPESNFLIDLYSRKCDTFHQRSSLYLFLKKQCDPFSNLNVTTKSARKRLLHDSNFNSTSEFEILKERISNSIQHCVGLEAIYEAAKMDLHFLKSLNVHDFGTNYNSVDLSFQLCEDKNILTRELLEKNTSTIEQLAQDIAEMFVNKHQLPFLCNIKQLKQRKLDRLEKVNTQMRSISAHHNLVYLLLKDEMNNIERTDSFIVNVHNYIKTVLYNYSLRINEMLKTTNDYCLFQKLSLEEKSDLLTCQRKILSDANDNTSPLERLMKDFNREQQKTELQLFHNCYYPHRSLTKNLEKRVAELQKILCNGPTSQIIIIPGHVQDCFEEINDLVNSLAISIKLCLQAINDSEKKLSESKCFKIKRLLWTWFLVDPNKLLAIMEEFKSKKNNQ